MGLNKSLKLPILGEGIPKIPHPSDSDWDGLDLPGWHMAMVLA